MNIEIYRKLLWDLRLVEILMIVKKYERLQCGKSAKQILVQHLLPDQIRHISEILPRASQIYSLIGVTSHPSDWEITMIYHKKSNIDNMYNEMIGARKTEGRMHPSYDVLWPMMFGDEIVNEFRLVARLIDKSLDIYPFVSPFRDWENAAKDYLMRRLAPQDLCELLSGYGTA